MQTVYFIVADGLRHPRHIHIEISLSEALRHRRTLVYTVDNHALEHIPVHQDHQPAARTALPFACGRAGRCYLFCESVRT